MTENNFFCILHVLCGIDKYLIFLFIDSTDDSLRFENCPCLKSIKIVFCRFIIQYPCALTSTSYSITCIKASHFNVHRTLFGLGIRNTYDGIIPEMRIWSISFIRADFKMVYTR